MNKNWLKINIVFITILLTIYSCDNKTYYAHFDGQSGNLAVDGELKIEKVFLRRAGPDTLFYFQAQQNSKVLSRIQLYDTSKITKLKSRLISDFQQRFILTIECLTKKDNKLKTFKEYYRTNNLFKINDTLASEGRI